MLPGRLMCGLGGESMPPAQLPELSHVVPVLRDRGQKGEQGALTATDSVWVSRERPGASHLLLQGPEKSSPGSRMLRDPG